VMPPKGQFVDAAIREKKKKKELTDDDGLDLGDLGLEEEPSDRGSSAPSGAAGRGGLKPPSSGKDSGADSSSQWSDDKSSKSKSSKSGTSSRKSGMPAI